MTVRFNHTKSHIVLVILPLLVALVFFTTTISVLASGALSQGFKTSDSLSMGSIVTLKNGSDGYVQLATSDESAQLVGVVGNKALIALNSGIKQTEVITSGVTDVLVSDINGPIKAGDKITSSPISGIGMKTKESSEIVGTAQTSFPGTKTSNYSVTDKSGETKQVKVGVVSLQVGVSYYNVSQDKLSSFVPSFLVNVGSSIAGKDISPIRVLVSFFCLLMGFVLAGVMIQSGVRSGIISVGRNPLAHEVLRRSLVDVLITAIAVLLITGIVFYLALTF